MKIIRKHFKTIGSTNTWSKQQAHTFDRDAITLVTTDEQTAGRGRFNRQWVSPPGQNIYATFNFFIPQRPDVGNIPQIMALSVAETLESLSFAPQLKWPNDVLLSQKKVAGILCETVSFAGIFCVVLGVGLNINMPIELLEKIDRPATSLLAEGKASLMVENVLELLTQTFLKNLTYFLSQGFSPFFKLYQSKMAFSQGQKIRFHDNLKVWEGLFHSINQDGSLNLIVESGEVRRFIGGEFI